MRTVMVPRKFELKDKSKIALFTLAWDNGKNGIGARFVSGDMELLPESDVLETLKFRPPFPDKTPVRILRAGWVSCSQYTTNCALILFLVDDQPSLNLVREKK
jgi:hypothetical protein